MGRPAVNDYSELRTLASGALFASNVSRNELALAEGVLALLDEAERLRQRTPRYTYACQRCGVRDGLDTSLPREQWAKIAAGTGLLTAPEWDVLCLWCIDEIATDLGLPETVAHLYFSGMTVRSALYEGDTDERWPQLIAMRDAEVERLRTALAGVAKAVVCPHGCRMCEHYEPIAIEALRSLGL